jgi:hypothetical protein
MIFCWAAVLTFVTGANAQVLLSDPSEFSVPTKLLDFETFPDGSSASGGFFYVHSDAWTNSGVVMTRNAWLAPLDYFSHMPPHSGSVALSGNDPYTERGGGIGFRFVLPGTTTPVAMSEAGIWVQHYVPPNPSRVRPLPIITFSFADGGEWRSVAREEDEFFGMRYSAGIVGISIAFSGGFPDTGYFTVDDLQFGPVPSAIVDTEIIPGGNIIAKWPAYYAAFLLQVTHDANEHKPEKTKWTNVTGTPALIGDTLCLTNRISEGKVFRIVPP